MLILTRRPGERLRIVTDAGEHIWVTILGGRGNQIRVGIDAPKTVKVMRDEILPPEERRAAPPVDA